MFVSRDQIIAGALCAVFACNLGCVTVSTGDRVGLLANSVPYVPEDGGTPVTPASSVVAAEEKPLGVLGKTKRAITNTGKAVGKTVLLVGIVLVAVVLHSNDDDSESDSGANHLWKQGYGFNNPNPDRIRNGQPVLNFDGSVAK